MSFKKTIPLLFILASLTLATLFGHESGGPKHNIYLEAPCLTGVLHADTRDLSGNMRNETAPGRSIIYSLDQDAVSGTYFQSAGIPWFQAFAVPGAARKPYTYRGEAKHDLITSSIGNKSPPEYLL
ncbi:MAG: hypothetical protein IT344_04855 [Candidatus Dadabacteria bacterium]|nr:hypothetical protein [Candidatus Dadabacteria bacterium]